MLLEEMIEKEEQRFFMAMEGFINSIKGLIE
jgi:hypothetical protein